MFKRIRRLRVKLSALAPGIMALALVGHAVLGVTYFQQWREQDTLSLEIEAARQSLAEYGDIASRQKQLAVAEADPASEQVAFPSGLNGPGTVGALIKLAQDIELKVVDVKTQPGREQQVGDHTYRSLSVHVQVKGALDALRTFVDRLEDGALLAVRVDELLVTEMQKLPYASPELSLDVTSMSELRYSVTASLDFSAYARY